MLFWSRIMGIDVGSISGPEGISSNVQDRCSPITMYGYWYVAVVQVNTIKNVFVGYTYPLCSTVFVHVNMKSAVDCWVLTLKLTWNFSPKISILDKLSNLFHRILKFNWMCSSQSSIDSNLDSQTNFANIHVKTAFTIV